jgi:hypothetical protein
LNEPTRSAPAGKVPDKVTPPKTVFKGIRLCSAKQPVPPVYADVMVKTIGESVAQLPAVTFVERTWHTWFTKQP